MATVSVARMFDMGFQCDDNRFDSGGQGFVLPHSHDIPARRDESHVGGSVSFHIPAKFRRPVPLVGRRLPAVFRAYVPEAAVDENGHLFRGEDDVGTDLDPIKVEPEILAVPEAESVQGTAQCYLRLGASPAVGAHVPGAPLVQGSRIQTLRMGLLARLIPVAPRHVHTSIRPEPFPIRKDTGAHAHGTNERNPSD